MDLISWRKAAEALVGDGRVCVTAEAWGGSAGEPREEFSIYRAPMDGEPTFYRGATPEETLRVCRERLGLAEPVPAPPLELTTTKQETP